jgi:hypothetical protein
MPHRSKVVLLYDERAPTAAVASQMLVQLHPGRPAFRGVRCELRPLILKTSRYPRVR